MKDEKELIQELRAYLEERSTMTLATIGKKGEPQSAPLFFVADEELNLYFLSDEDSRHGANIMERSVVAVSIYTETHDWRNICGVQLEGVASLINDPSIKSHAWSRYKSKFPFVVTLAARVMASRWFVVHPTWIRWIDNQVRFGYKQELVLEEIQQTDKS